MNYLCENEKMRKNEIIKGKNIEKKKGNKNFLWLILVNPKMYISN